MTLAFRPEMAGSWPTAVLSCHEPATISPAPATAATPAAPAVAFTVPAQASAASHRRPRASGAFQRRQ
ncbi:MAG: hypothetical protein M5U18_16065 [Dehalococcoidia bacterium]|nr:hypothetical protein [Dehalococcoidia bacterium]